MLYFLNYYYMCEYIVFFFLFNLENSQFIVWFCWIQDVGITLFINNFIYMLIFVVVFLVVSWSSITHAIQNEIIISRRLGIVTAGVILYADSSPKDTRYYYCILIPFILIWHLLFILSYDQRKKGRTTQTIMLKNSYAIEKRIYSI